MQVYNLKLFSPKRRQ